ncbi:MAG: acyl-[acyl-carrier-protein] thioesterase [Treponemataceae bacterium]|nr:acyl-[acyl-carrier-protein] thioesterase [Treponemataceae bacterium]
MSELKYWHDENDGFTFYCQNKVGFNKCDRKGTLQLSELFGLTSDVAVADYQIRGLDYKFLAEHGVALLISRVSYRIIKLPVENQIITIKTWEEKPKGLQLSRHYCIYDQDGNEMVNSDTTWLYVDVNSRRILPAVKFDMRPQPVKVTELKSLEAGKIRIPENISLAEKRVMRYSDGDPNGHINNSRYAAFALDSLAPEIQAMDLCDIRLNYAKEAHIGDTLDIFNCTEKTEDGRTRCVIVGKNNTETSFECEMFFK